MKVLVTGSNGQLGSEIRKVSINHNFDWIFTNTNEFDLLDTANINNFLDSVKPSLIINCAAFTNVDSAEDNYGIANVINNISVSIIAKWAFHNNSKLIHISTDFIFDGLKNKPIIETDCAKPLNNYGKTKLNGELNCLKFNKKSIIIRTSSLYSSYGNNFVKTIIKNLKNFRKINVVTDLISSPTYAADLTDVILLFISNMKIHSGIFNYSNSGKVSKFRLATNIKNLLGLSNVEINPISYNDLNVKAQRPKFTVLDNSKIKCALNIEQKNYLDSLNKCLKILKNHA